MTYLLKYKNSGIIYQIEAETLEEIMEHVLNCLNHAYEVMEVLENDKVILYEADLMKKFNRRYY